jgi:serine/threonine protein kinase/Tfp pilus assembly protein PilF
MLTDGTRLGRYEVRSKVGEGGMGEVYLAQDAKLDRKVALKILPANVADNRDRMNRFVREARAASALNHPNIITIYEIDQAELVNFIATEFIDGKTLRQRIKSGRLSTTEALDVAIQVASALAAAHEAGIVHRDIKPENIMIRRDHLVKVLDFGLAKLTSDTQAVEPEAETKVQVRTMAGMIMGTVHYMSPEQARGLELDARTDVWSLGVLIHEMVAGCIPFAGETNSDVIASILKTEPAPIKELAPDAPDELQRIVTKTLRVKKEERYQNAQDLLIDLKNLKQELEFSAKLERTSASKEFGVVASSQKVSTSAVTTIDRQTAKAGSSAEYVVAKIKTHRRAVIAALLVLIIGVVVLTYFLTRNRTANNSGGNTTIDSLAVLPFANTSQDPNAEYLSDGITESLINTLSQLPSLRVLSRSAAFRYKGQDIDAKKVGADMNVRAVLKGGVKQLGDQLVVNVELIDARDNHQIWGDQYVRKFADVLSVQRDIVQEVSGKLRLKLSSVEQQKLAKRPTDNPEAYRLYLLGKYSAVKMTPESFAKGIKDLQQAIDLDPNYALAYSGLAFYYVQSLDQILPPKEAMPKSRDAAIKALALDDSLAEAHVALAYVYWQYDWDWSRAEQEFRRALELDPNNPDTHGPYGFFLALMGRFDEGIAEVSKATELNPLSIETGLYEAPSYYLARRYDEAIKKAQKIIDLAPDFWLPHLIAGRGFEQKGQLPAALAEYQKARAGDNSTSEILMDLGRAYGLAGRRAEAEGVLNELKARTKTGYVSPFQIAMVHIGLGEEDQALAALEQAYEARSWYMTWLKTAPEFDPLRSDPRFVNLMHRVGF